MNKVLFIMCLLIITGRAIAESDDGEIRAVYVRGVVKLQVEASLPMMGNIYPWEVQVLRGEKLISNACGFGKATYNTCSPDHVVHCAGTVDAIFLRGEWCEVREYVYDDPTVLILKRWNGQDYIIEDSEVIAVRNGRPFIVDLEFVATWGMSAALEDLPESEACLDTDFLSPDQLDTFARDMNSTIGKNELCFKRGLSVKNMLNHFPGKLIEPTAPQAGAPTE